MPQPIRKTTLNALKRQRTQRLAKLVSKAYFLQQRGRTDDLYTLICDEFVSLGGVYVKFLQGVLLNTAIMKKWHNANRMNIFENLDTEDIDVVAMLQNQLSSEKLQDITLIQPKPFAAGSFGQVYYGQHKNGKAIIVKVMRPQVRELLRYDLKLLTMFTKAFISREYKNVNMNLTSAFREFRHSTLRETDYTAEARFANELYEAYRDDPLIVIPKTYLDLCTSHVIVQDYLPGLSLVEVMKAQQAGQDPVEFVKKEIGSDLDQQLIVFGAALIAGTLNLPRIQGDPHPGNIRLLPDNKVGTIDFGISASSPKNQAAFFQIIDQWSRMYSDKDEQLDVVAMFESFMRFFVNDLYNALKKISGRSDFRPQSAEESATQQNMVQEVGKIVRDMVRSAIGSDDIKHIIEQGKILDLFSNVVNRDNRLGLVMKLDASEILRACQTYFGLVGNLGRNKVVLPRIFDRSIAEIEKAQPNIRYQTDETMTMGQAFEVINTWLERVASRDPDLFRELLNKVQLDKPAAKPAEPKPEENHA